jgi:hypothetical protein
MYGNKDRRAGLPFRILPGNKVEVTIMHREKRFDGVSRIAASAWR